MSEPLPLTIADLVRVRKLLDRITVEDFREILGTVLHADESYIRACWPSFDDNRIGYIVSRSPIKQGEALLARALEREAGKR